jgi:hypothetical protein
MERTEGLSTLTPNNQISSPEKTLDQFSKELLLKISEFLFDSSPFRPCLTDASFADQIALKRTCRQFYKISFDLILPKISCLAAFEENSVSLSIHDLSLGIFVFGLAETLGNTTSNFRSFKRTADRRDETSSSSYMECGWLITTMPKYRKRDS